MQNIECYEYGLKIKGYLDKMGQSTVKTSFHEIRKNVGLPDDAVGRIALYSVPHYRTNYHADREELIFIRHD